MRHSSPPGLSPGPELAPSSRRRGCRGVIGLDPSTPLDECGDTTASDPSVNRCPGLDIVYIFVCT
jgi:hypothetical protein